MYLGLRLVFVSSLFVLMNLASGCADVLAFDLYASVDEFTVPGDANLHHGKAPLSAATIPDMEIQFAAMDARSISISSVRFFVTDTDLGQNADTDNLQFLDARERIPDIGCTQSRVGRVIGRALAE